MEKRVTVKEIKKAYEDTGITPVNCETLNSRECMACPMGVLYFNTHPNHKHLFKNDREKAGTTLDNRIFNWANKVYGKDYVEGFIDGVDGLGASVEMESYLNIYRYGSNDEWKKGYRDGRDVLEEVFDD